MRGEDHYCRACHRWIGSMGWATHRSGKQHKANVKAMLERENHG